jgi:hypothetical protein
LIITNKKEKPKILTESDHILNSLQEELAGLKSRMNLIEAEQEQNRTLLERLSFQEDLNNELILGRQEDIAASQDNYKVIANVIHNLKSPVNSVVDNLAGIIAEIDDQETQQTLKNCMQTAANVLSTFDEVEDFCLDISSGFETCQQQIGLRTFFKEILTEIQSRSEFKHLKSLRLQIEKSLPEEGPLVTDTVKGCLDCLLKELTAVAPSGTAIIIRIASENNATKYGIPLSDLAVYIDLESATELTWGDSWLESITQNQTKLIHGGFNLLRIRDSLRKSGGQLEVRTTDKKVSGFKFCLPLTY